MSQKVKTATLRATTHAQRRGFCLLDSQNRTLEFIHERTASLSWRLRRWRSELEKPSSYHVRNGSR